MKAHCTVEKLKNAVSLAERMVGKNLTLPSLHGLLIIASGTSLKIRATNLNVGIEVEVPAVVQQEGVVLVKGDLLSNVCGNLKDTLELDMYLEGDNLTISTVSSKTVLKCLNYEDFPTLPIVEGETFEIKSSVFQEGIRSVYFSAAITEIKPEIASIFIYSEDANLCFVATDSFRLAEKKLKVKNIPDIPKILIPYKNIADMLKALDSVSDMVRVTFTRNQMSLSGNGVYFTTRLIDGSFPQYQLIIPKVETTKVVLMKQELVSTLRLSTIFADKFFQVLFSVSPVEKRITIDSKNNDVGSSVSSIDAVVEGDGIEVSFNLKYFLDVFQALSGDSVAISFTAPNKPIVVRSVQDTSFLYLIMPTNR